jgi:hypothetical protein
MDKKIHRVLGRVLAVEETRTVSGAQSTMTDAIDDPETSPQADISTAQSDQTDPVGDSGTVQDTGAVSDSGTAEDTGVLIDCIASTTTAEACIAD